MGGDGWAWASYSDCLQRLQLDLWETYSGTVGGWPIVTACTPLGRQLREAVCLPMSSSARTGLMALAGSRGWPLEYAIGEIIVLARQIARQNGLEDRISFVRGTRGTWSSRSGRTWSWALIGSIGLDEDVITIFCDARKLPQTGRAPCYRMASISSSPLPRKGSTKAIWTGDLERACGPAVLPGAVATTMVQNGFLSGWVSWFVARYRGVVFLTTRPR